MSNKQYTMTRGDTPSWDLYVSDSSGNAVNLTGVSIRFTAKKSLADTDGSAVFAKTVGSGIVLKDQTNPTTKGYCTATLLSSDTSSLSAVTWPLYYDWQVTDGSGLTKTVESGTLVVNPDVGQTVP